MKYCNKMIDYDYLYIIFDKDYLSTSSYILHIWIAWITDFRHETLAWGQSLGHNPDDARDNASL